LGRCFISLSAVVARGCTRLWFANAHVSSAVLIASAYKERRPEGFVRILFELFFTIQWRAVTKLRPQGDFPLTLIAGAEARRYFAARYGLAEAMPLLQSMAPARFRNNLHWRARPKRLGRVKIRGFGSGGFPVGYVPSAVRGGISLACRGLTLPGNPRTMK
jgi:hypothetical protein